MLATWRGEDWAFSAWNDAIRGVDRLRAVDPDDRHGAALHLRRLGASGAGEMPPAYVRAVFDQYAPRFEKSLVGDLGYRGPALLLEAIYDVTRATGRPARFSRALDLGCGTGETTATLAPFVGRVIAVDASTEMLQEARQRVTGAGNVDLRRGDLESLPIDDHRLDIALVTLVLHHVADPAAALREVARVLKADGRLVLVDMLPHDRDTYRQQMGHVWLGFSEDQVTGWLADAGFTDLRLVPLAPDPRAKGPGLFVATGRVTSPSPTQGDR